LDKDEQKKFVGDESRAPLTTEQITYCAADVEFLEALVEIITAKIERKDQFEGSKIVARVQREEDFLPLLAALELRGFSVNEDALTELEQDVKLRLETIEKVLVGLLRPNLKQLKLNFGKPVAFIPTKFTEQDLQTAFQLEAGTEQSYSKD
jgi:DNA polymerase I-like protein with 3'-5' exonuclease and polymerase domains